MILVREVFQATYGKGDELVQFFKDFSAMMSQNRTAPNVTLLTDLSGPFYTVVVETKAESVDAYMNAVRESFSRPEFREWFGRTTDLVESGRREFYNIEATTG